MFRPSRASDLRLRVSALLVAAMAMFGLLSGMGGTPAVAALIAAVSGEHKVGFGLTDEHFRLVLSHDNTVPERSVTHHHGFGSRLAMIFGETGAPPNGDHVLNFDRLKKTTRVKLSTPVSAPAITAVRRQEFLHFTFAPAHAEIDDMRRWDGWMGMPIGRMTARLI